MVELKRYSPLRLQSSIAYKIMIIKHEIAILLVIYVTFIFHSDL